VVIAAAFSLPARAVLIDDFTDASTVTVGPAVGSASVLTLDFGPPSIIGGSRKSEVFKTAPATGTAVVKVFTTVGTGLGGTPVMAYSADPGSVGAMELTYDDSGFGLGSGLGADLTLGGDNAFGVGVNFADFMAPLSISVTDFDGDFSTSGPHPMPFGLPGGAPVDVAVPYASFSPLIDFTAITSIRFSFDATVAATDLEVLFLESTFVVPEPATFAGLSLMGLLVLTRRRRS